MLEQRSYKRELLDNDSIPFADIKQNMKELQFINSTLGGHEITLQGFKKLLKDRKKISVCEIGCGGGDNLLAINNWCIKKKVDVFITGIDIKTECIEFAKQRTKISSAEWFVNDYQKVRFKEKPDIIFSSLFCHHFSDEELIYQFKWMKENSRVGFFINDLHRNVIAYYSIKILTRLFSSSYLVKNDAPLSVVRGFTSGELTELLKKACVDGALVKWKWAFRYLVTFTHE